MPFMLGMAFYFFGGSSPFSKMKIIGYGIGREIYSPIPVIPLLSTASVIFDGCYRLGSLLKILRAQARRKPLALSNPVLILSLC